MIDQVDFEIKQIVTTAKTIKSHILGKRYKKYLPRNDVPLSTGDSKLFLPGQGESMCHKIRKVGH